MNTKAEDPASTGSSNKSGGCIQNNSPFCSNTVPRSNDSFQDRGPEICQDNNPHIFQDRGPDSSQYKNPYMLQSPGKPAADLTALGFNVIPLEEAGKEPHYAALKAVRESAKWSPLRDKPLTVAEVERIYRDYRAGLGVLTGVEVQGGYLAVVDVDDIYSMPMTRLPATVTASTGVGFHYYYLSDKPVPTRSLECNGVHYGEIRGIGGYVRCPPSFHPDTGECYLWILPPHTNKIADLPVELYKRTSNPTDTNNTIIGVKDSIIGVNLNELNKLTGSDLVTALVQSEEAARRILEHYDIKTAPLGTAFVSPFPGDTDDQPSAVLLQGRGGQVWIRDFGGGRCGPWITVPEVARWKAAGINLDGENAYERAAKLRIGTPAQLKVWHLRGAIESGVLRAPVIHPKPITVDVNDSVRKVYNGLILRYQVELLLNPQNPAVPFTWSFACEWCGVKSHNTVKAAIKWLLKNGFIHTCGMVKVHGHAVNMFCIGPSDGLRGARKSEPAEVNAEDVVSVGEVLKVL